MVYGILIKNRTQSMTDDSKNRSVQAAADIANGGVFRLDAQGSQSGSAAEVWSATAAAVGTYDGLWMAASPEVVITSSKYKGIDPDPRNFVNPAGYVFDAFKPCVGDVITLSSYGISGSPSTGDYVTSGSQAYTLLWASSGSINPFGGRLTMKLLAETYVSIGTGAIDNQRVLAYKLQVLFNGVNN